ncbi:hypothetical protein NLI96_g506 [Meripilus lineatus]|uniref:F-box domain-containing protein n=1 Tax=Meripilus lineatus TaxID=2056292 RepID=A0AAD5VDI9_9APHY|nr:hypothetical protein NLI96_g506 [Physisporinus lineatus]
MSFPQPSRLNFDILANLDGPLIQELTKIIRCSKGLEELVINDTDEFLSYGGEIVFDILSDLTSHHFLTNLKLGGVGIEASRLLQGMKTTSVQKLSLTFVYAGSIDEPDPFLVLTSLGPNLTTLSIENAIPHSVGVQCPRVHTVDLSMFGLVSLRSLTHMFPNLANLSFYSESGGEDNQDRVEERRAENLAEFEADGSPWSSLQRLEGSIRQLYMIGFPFHVKSLELSLMATKEIPMCLALLDSLSPNILDLSIYVGQFQALSELETFLTRAFGGLTQCTHLSLTFSMEGMSSRPSDFESMLLSALEKLTVRLLGIRFPRVISWSSTDFDGWDSIDPDQPGPDPLQSYLCAIDTKALATTIAERIPSLHHVGLDVANQSRTGGYWEIVRNQGVAPGTISLKRVCDFSRHWRTMENIPEVGELGNKN